MKIELSNQYIKSYKKRIRGNIKLESRVKKRVQSFILNRESIELRDHALIGRMKGLRSFSVAGDLRIIYKVDPKDNLIVFIFLDIGSHNQVY